MLQLARVWNFGCHMHASNPPPVQQMSISWPAAAAPDTALCVNLQLQKLRLAARQAARSGAGPAQAPQQSSPATLAPATFCPGQEGSATADIPVPAPKGVRGGKATGKKGKGKAAQEAHGKAAAKEEKSKVRRVRVQGSTPSLAGVQFRSSPAVPTSADAWVCHTALQHSTGWFTGILDTFCTETTFTWPPSCMRRQVLHHSFAGTSPDSTSLVKPGRRRPCMLVAAGAGASSRAETGAAVGCFCLCLAGDSRDAGHAGHRHPSAAGDRFWFAYLQITSFGGPSRRQKCFRLHRIWWGCCVGGRCCISMQGSVVSQACNHDTELCRDSLLMRRPGFGWLQPLTHAA